MPCSCFFVCIDVCASNVLWIYVTSICIRNRGSDFCLVVATLCSMCISVDHGFVLAVATKKNNNSFWSSLRSTQNAEHSRPASTVLLIGLKPLKRLFDLFSVSSAGGRRRETTAEPLAERASVLFNLLCQITTWHRAYSASAQTPEPVPNEKNRTEQNTFSQTVLSPDIVTRRRYPTEKREASHYRATTAPGGTRKQNSTNFTKAFRTRLCLQRFFRTIRCFL